MNKISDLEKKERNRLENELDTKAKLIGVEDRWERTKFECDRLEGFGLCSSCKNFEYARTEFVIRIAKCYELDIKLDESNPITECTCHSKKGELTLNMMMEMAILIGEPKNNIGFE